MKHDIGDQLGQALAMAQVLGDAARVNAVAGGRMDADTVGWYAASLEEVLQRAQAANDARALEGALRA